MGGKAGLIDFGEVLQKMRKATMVIKNWGGAELEL